MINEDDSQTCWTMIRDAGAGNKLSMDLFARLYEPVVKAYFISRWMDHACKSDIGDAIQDVFVECLRPNGVLDKVDSGRVGGFRPYLYGVIRNIARRHETRRKSGPMGPEPVADESSLGKAFDREYARSIMKEASRIQAERATASGDAAVRRIELLRLRFRENLPIREIAEAWGADPAALHHEYATAREEFRLALRSIVRFHNPTATDSEITLRCTELIDCLK